MSNQNVGTVFLHQYRLLTEISRTEFAVTFRAEQLGVRREVAVTVLAPCHEDALEHFARAVSVTASLRHPSTVIVHDAGHSDNGEPFFVTELVPGPTLATLLQRDGPVRPQRALRLVAQVANSLREAHLHGVVHGDLSVASVSVFDRADAHDVVKVADYGFDWLLSVLFGQRPSPRSYPIAPDLLAGGEPSVRTDLFAVGLLVFELLVGRRATYREDGLTLDLDDPLIPSRVAQLIEAATGGRAGYGADAFIADLERCAAALPADRHITPASTPAPTPRDTSRPRTIPRPTPNNMAPAPEMRPDPHADLSSSGEPATAELQARGETSAAIGTQAPSASGEDLQTRSLRPVSAAELTAHTAGAPQPGDFRTERMPSIPVPSTPLHRPGAGGLDLEPSSGNVEMTRDLSAAEVALARQTVVEPAEGPPASHDVDMDFDPPTEDLGAYPEAAALAKELLAVRPALEGMAAPVLGSLPSTEHTMQFMGSRGPASEVPDATVNVVASDILAAEDARAHREVPAESTMEIDFDEISVLSETASDSPERTREVSLDEVYHLFAAPDAGDEADPTEGRYTDFQED